MTNTAGLPPQLPNARLKAMKATPLISVIMPAYNAERHVAEAIASVKAQHWTNWELIVVDDGSTDRTAEIANARPDPRIRLLRQENRGVSAARNAALDQAQGDCIAFLDADDLMPPESLEARVRLLMQDDGLFFADGAVHSFTDDPAHAKALYCPTFEGVPFDALMALDGSCFFGNTWMIRRAPGTNVRFPMYMRHAEDLAYYLGMARAGRYSFTTEPVLYCRRGHISAMTDLDGLWTGYRQLHLWAKCLEPEPDPALLLTMWAKARRIMVRSFLKNGRFAAALGAWVARPLIH